MLFVEGELTLELLDFSLFFVKFLHQTVKFLQGNLDNFTAVGACLLCETVLFILFSADFCVLSPHFDLSVVVLYLESFCLRNRSFSSLILLVHPLSFQIPISFLEGSNQSHFVALLHIPPLSHIFLLITLQFHRMFLMRVSIPTHLHLFGDSLQVRLTPLLEDALHRHLDIFQSA